MEEIWVNEPDRVFVARNGEHELTGLVLDARDVEEIVERMLARAGRRLDRAQPFVDARLPDGSRLHVTIPPITDHWSVNVRKFVGLRAHSCAELVELGSCSPAAARFLDASVQAGLSVVVAGAVGAGKTTLLNCLLAAVPARERIVTCEEVFELRVDRPDVVAMQCRQPNLEGEGAVTLRDLVRESLRMRPDRIVVGEVRGAETLDMLLALNSGAAGMTSVHANSAREALRKLTTLPLLAGDNLDRRFVAATVAACVDLVVFCRRVDGVRQITEIVSVAEQVTDGDELTTGTVFAGAGRGAAMDRRVPDRDRRGTRRPASTCRGCSDECAAPVRARARRVPRVRRVDTDAATARHACGSDRFAAWLRRQDWRRSGRCSSSSPVARSGSPAVRSRSWWSGPPAWPWSRRWRPRRRRSRTTAPASRSLRAQRRRAWPDAIELLAGAVRTGDTLPAALAVVGDRGPIVLRPGVPGARLGSPRDRRPRRRTRADGRAGRGSGRRPRGADARARPPRRRS